MASVCFYFQVHQPFRLRDYPFLNIGHDPRYEATNQNSWYLQRVAERCYLPANRLMLELIKRYNGKFRISYSISGVCLEQMQLYAPEVLASFQELVATGCVEILGETYYHSLAALYSDAEFERQVLKHKALIKQLFNYEPTTFRNTELIYNDHIAAMVEKLGFTAMLCEDAARILNGNPSIKIYTPPQSELKLFPRNHVLSDDIAFRFDDASWPEYPLFAHKYASWIHKQAAFADVINLFMDYETFGEHRRKETGIFQFMYHLPEAVLSDRDFKFRTPAEAKQIHRPYGTMPVSIAETTSWADDNRDLSAWTHDAMQRDALKRVYALEPKIRRVGTEKIWHEWGKLQTSDHFYYMSVRYWGDKIHDVFTPFGSPYDAYINYMNILSDFEIQLNRAPVYHAY